jgi:phenylpropionate dioxygenase-like ring-hydroxylating dioxygenase large terminal subunit
MEHKDPFSPDEVRDDFVPKDAYFDPSFAALEAKRLWPKVWQIACRLEEIKNVGDYVTYDILDESIIVVRDGIDSIRAFHNVCPHRGNQLTEGCGTTRRFVCSFHGWQFALSGENTKLVDRQDWGNCLSDEDVHLREVRVGTWAGFVFINMDPDAQELYDFLSPLKERCDRYEMEKLRFAWYKTVILPANWKTALEAFTEFYHLQQTHSQMLAYTNDYSSSAGLGRHGSISYDASSGLPLGRSPRLPSAEPKDFREYVFEFAEQMRDDLQAMQTERAYVATQRLRDEVAHDAAPLEVLTKWSEFIRQAAEEAGTGWPTDLTPEYATESGFDWHLFPNSVFLHSAVEAVLWYRSRPNGKDPESCIFDIWSLERFSPGKEPPIVREFFDDWRDGDWPLIFRQDFLNIPKVQKGVKSSGFRGARPSPVQERAITNFHRILRRFLQDPHADDASGRVLS